MRAPQKHLQGVLGMRFEIRCSAVLRFVASLIMGLPLVGRAGAADMREFIHETQQSATVSQELTLAWWIPQEFWDLSLAENPNVPAQTAADIRAVFHDYQVFALIRASVGIQGLTGAPTRADLWPTRVSRSATKRSIQSIRTRCRPACRPCWGPCARC